MPSYAWRAIDIKGKIYKGCEIARSETDLEIILFSKNLGLIECHEKKYQFNETIPSKLKYFFIENIYTLLKSQIRLQQAIELTLNTISHAKFKDIIKDINLLVLEGKPLYEALGLYPKVFDILTVNIIRVGELSSNLINALEHLVNHNQQIREIKTKTRSALLIPIVTFTFFMFIMLIFFILVVPRFESFFKSFQAPLPTITKIILGLSMFIRSYFLYLLVLSIPTIFLASKILHFFISKKVRDYFLLSLPIIKNFSLANYKLRFLQILSISLSSGMHLLNSLNLAYNFFNNVYFKDMLKKVIFDVENGIDLSDSLEQTKINDAEIISLLRIGECSGNLSGLTSKSLDIHRKKFYSLIEKFSSLIHPIILLILGFLIAVSIFSIYVPVFTLTNLIN